MGTAAGHPDPDPPSNITRALDYWAPWPWHTRLMVCTVGLLVLAGLHVHPLASTGNSTAVRAAHARASHRSNEALQHTRASLSSHDQMATRVGVNVVGGSQHEHQRGSTIGKRVRPEVAAGPRANANSAYDAVGSDDDANALPLQLPPQGPNGLTVVTAATKNHMCALINLLASLRLQAPDVVVVVYDLAIGKQHPLDVR